MINPEQKLPAVEPGHVSDQKLPRVEGSGVQDDVPHSEYPKWIQHRGMGPILVQNADEEADRVAESDALPEPPPADVEVEKATAEIEKIVERSLTDLERSRLVAEVKRMAAEDAARTYSPVPDPMEQPAILIESAAAENARLAYEHGIDLSTVPDVPEAPVGESPLHVVIDKLPVE